jgi:hypothetical protein
MRDAAYYRRRTRVRFAFWTAITIALVWTLTAAVRAQTHFDCVDEPVVVSDEEGLSLWTIAHRNCTGAVDVVVHNLVERYSTTVHRGQLIYLP